jgi:hypothetical protein
MVFPLPVAWMSRFSLPHFTLDTLVAFFSFFSFFSFSWPWQQEAVLEVE